MKEFDAVAMLVYKNENITIMGIGTHDIGHKST
jgi:hypothetical protein